MFLISIFRTIFRHLVENPITDLICMIPIPGPQVPVCIAKDTIGTALDAEEMLEELYPVAVYNLQNRGCGNIDTVVDATLQANESRISSVVSKATHKIYTLTVVAGIVVIMVIALILWKIGGFVRWGTGILVVVVALSLIIPPILINSMIRGTVDKGLKGALGVACGR